MGPQGGSSVGAPEHQTTMPSSNNEMRAMDMMTAVVILKRGLKEDEIRKSRGSKSFARISMTFRDSFYNNVYMMQMWWDFAPIAISWQNFWVSGFVIISVLVVYYEHHVMWAHRTDDH